MELDPKWNWIQNGTGSKLELDPNWNWIQIGTGSKMELVPILNFLYQTDKFVKFYKKFHELKFPCIMN